MAVIIYILIIHLYGCTYLYLDYSISMAALIYI